MPRVPSVCLHKIFALQLNHMNRNMVKQGQAKADLTKMFYFCLFWNNIDQNPHARLQQGQAGWSVDIFNILLCHVHSTWQRIAWGKKKNVARPVCWDHSHRQGGFVNDTGKKPGSQEVVWHRKAQTWHTHFSDDVPTDRDSNSSRTRHIFEPCTVEQYGLVLASMEKKNSQKALYRKHECLPIYSLFVNNDN